MAGFCSSTIKPAIDKASLSNSSKMLFTRGLNLIKENNMKKILLFIAIILNTPSLTTAQSYKWAKAEEYPSFVTFTNLVITDILGNTFIGGNAKSGIGLYLIKYDSSGEKLWEKKYSGYASNLGSLCTDNAGNLYVTFVATNVEGQNFNPNNGSLFAKYDSSGNLLWIKQIKYWMELSERTDANNDLIVAGQFEGTLNLENGITFNCPSNESHLFMAKYNLNGECIWGIQDDGGGHMFKCNKQGEKAVICELYGRTMTIGKGDKQTTFYPSSSGNDQGYIAKYKANGELAWAKQLITCGIALDDFGNVYSFQPDLLNMSKAYLAKYDPNGTLIWKKVYAHFAGWYKFSMDCGKDGCVYMTGGFSGSMSIGDTTITDSNARTYTAKIDSEGNLRWIVLSGGSGWAGGKDIAVSGNDVFITGDMGGDVSFGASNTSQQYGGVYVAKITDLDTATPTKENPVFTSELNVFPNPSNTLITISYSNSFSKEISISIKNQLGQQILKKTFPASNELKQTFDLGGQCKGVYFIEIISGDSREIRKIILE